MNATRSGGQVLAQALRRHATDRVYCVPGESYLAVLDALYDTPEIHLVTCRHESASAFMAEADGKLTGRPGVVFVTRGPGASNAAAGIHVARQDATPMIVFVGQVARSILDRDAFQEVDFRAFFAPLAKWAAQIESAERIPEYVNRAFHTATAGRPGPVVLALPEDVLSEQTDAADCATAAPPLQGPGEHAAGALTQALEKAKRPLVIAGGPGWTAQARAELQDFAERLPIPVTTSFRAQDRFDNTHDCYAGHVGLGIDPALAQAVREADLIVAIGTRLDDKTTGGYTLLQAPQPHQRLLHVFPGAEELGRVYRADWPVCSPVAAFCAVLANVPKRAGGDWRQWRDRLRSAYLAHHRPVAQPGPVQLGEIVAWLGKTLAPDAIVTNGAGNYAAWVHRHYPYRRLHTQLAPVSGSMGYGLPASIAAKLRHPEREVVCFAGDGCLQMSIQELATAAEQRAAVIIIVINNGLYGTIRMHQALHYPGRQKNTALRNPDFMALARAYGLHSERVAETAEFCRAFERARAAARPALIEVVTDPDGIAPGRRLSEMEG